MSVLYLVFQIPCLCLLISSPLYSFPWQPRRDLASFLWRGEEWLWNGHVLGVCNSRRGCSKLRNLMNIISLGSWVISELHFTLLSASIWKLKSRCTTVTLKLLFLPLQICWQLRAYFPTLLSQGYTNGGPKFLRIVPCMVVCLRSQSVIWAVAGKRNLRIISHLTSQHIFSKILELALH